MSAADYEKEYTPWTSWGVLPTGDGVTVNAGTYRLTANMTKTGSSASATANAVPGMSIAAGAVVVIYIPGNMTLTVTGGNGFEEKGGAAGILVPSNSTLILRGEGTLKATGGKTGTAKNGGNGANGFDNSATAASGNGGDGGNGGGGGGAGIGTSGSNGGAGGNGGNGVLSDLYNLYLSGNDGGNGGNGGQVASVGTIVILDKLTVTAAAGAAAYSGSASGGSRGNPHYKRLLFYSLGLHSGGGGAGGQGGQGADIGAGGSGGGGGAGGGSGVAIYFSDYINFESGGWGTGGVPGKGTPINSSTGKTLDYNPNDTTHNGGYNTGAGDDYDYGYYPFRHNQYSGEAAYGGISGQPGQPGPAAANSGILFKSTITIYKPTVTASSGSGRGAMASNGSTVYRTKLLFHLNDDAETPANWNTAPSFMYGYYWAGTGVYTQTLPTSPRPTRTDYTFSGWQNTIKNADASDIYLTTSPAWTYFNNNATNNPKATSTVDGERTLYARWAAVYSTVRITAEKNDNGRTPNVYAVGGTPTVTVTNAVNAVKVEGGYNKVNQSATVSFSAGTIDAGYKLDSFVFDSAPTGVTGGNSASWTKTVNNTVWKPTNGTDTTLTFVLPSTGDGQYIAVKAVYLWTGAQSAWSRDAEWWGRAVKGKSGSSYVYENRLLGTRSFPVSGTHYIGEVIRINRTDSNGGVTTDWKIKTDGGTSMPNPEYYQLTVGESDASKKYFWYDEQKKNTTITVVYDIGGQSFTTTYTVPHEDKAYLVTSGITFYGKKITGWKVSETPMNEYYKTEAGTSSLKDFTAAYGGTKAASGENAGYAPGDRVNINPYFGDQTVTFKFVDTLMTVTALAKDSGTGAVLSEEVHAGIEIGSTRSFAAPSVELDDGQVYELDGATYQSFTNIQPDVGTNPPNKTVTFYYRSVTPKPGDIVLHLAEPEYDDNGVPKLDKNTMTGATVLRDYVVLNGTNIFDTNQHIKKGSPDYYDAIDPNTNGYYLKSLIGSGNQVTSVTGSGGVYTLNFPASRPDIRTYTLFYEKQKKDITPVAYAGGSKIATFDAPPETARSGENYTVKAPVVPGYTLDDDFEKVVFVEPAAAGQSVVFNYIKTEFGTISVEHYYLDGAEKRTLAMAAVSGITGQSALVDPLDPSIFPGYELSTRSLDGSSYSAIVGASGNSVSIDSVSKDGHKVEFVYTDKRPTVKVTAKSSSDGVLLFEYTKRLDTAAAKFTVEQSELPYLDVNSYTLPQAEANKLVNITNPGLSNTTSIALTYTDVRKLVKIFTSKAYETPIPVSAATEKLAIGTNKRFYPPAMADYIATEYSTDGGQSKTKLPITDIYVDLQNLQIDTDIIFYYSKINSVVPQGTVSVKVRGISGDGSLLHDSMQTFNQGSGLHVIDAPTIYGYKLAQGESGSVTVNVQTVADPPSVTFKYESRATEVKIFMVDATDEGNHAQMGSAMPVSAIEGEPFTFRAPVVPGYYLSSVSHTGPAFGSDIGYIASVAAGGSSLTFYYKAFTPISEARFKAVDKSAKDKNGEPVVYGYYKLDALESGEKEYAIPDLTAYYLKPAQGQNPTVTYTWSGKPDELTIYYERLMSTIEVRFVNRDTNSAFQTETVSAPQGDAVTLAAKNFSSYLLISDAAKTIVPTGTTQTVDFEYVPNGKGEIFVKALTNDGKSSLIQEYPVVAAVGDSVTIAAPQILGWNLAAGKPDMYTFTVKESGNPDATFYYNQDGVTVTINAVDNDGKSITSQISQRVSRGASFTAYAPFVAGFVVPTGGITEIPFTAISKDTDVSFTYITIAEAAPSYTIPITVRYLESKAGDLIFSYMQVEQKADEKSVFISPPPALEMLGKNYYILKDYAAPVEVLIDGSDKTPVVDFYYSDASIQITVSCVTEGGAPLAPPEYFDATIGRPFTTKAPYFADYELVSVSPSNNPVSTGYIDSVSEADRNIGFTYRLITKNTNPPGSGNEKAPKTVLVTVGFEDVFGTNLADNAQYTALDGSIFTIRAPNFYEYALSDILINGVSSGVSGSATLNPVEDGEHNSIVFIYEADDQNQTPTGPVDPSDPSDPLTPEVITTPSAGIWTTVFLIDDEYNRSPAGSLEDEYIIRKLYLPAWPGVAVDVPDLGSEYYVSESMPERMPSDLYEQYAQNGNSYVIKYYYSKLTRRVTVALYAVDLDENGDVVYDELGNPVYDPYDPASTIGSPADLGFHPIGEVLEVDAPSISGFRPLDGASRIYTLVSPDPGTLVVPVLYRPLVDKEVYVELRTLLEKRTIGTYSLTSATAEYVAVSPPVLPGYSYMGPDGPQQRLSRASAPASSEAVTVKTPASLTFLYSQGDAIVDPVNYVTIHIALKNASMQTITPPSGIKTDISVLKGDNAIVYAPHLAGYVLSDGQEQSQSFTNVQRDMTWAVTYTVFKSGGGGTVEVPGETNTNVVYVNQPVNQMVSSKLITDEHVSYVKGHGDGTFGPDDMLTRAETTVMFYTLTQNKDLDPSKAILFSDVPQGAWFFDTATFMSATGIIDGYPDGSFRPNQHVTRAEFAAMLSKYDMLKKTPASPFSDVTKNHWAHDYIMSAYVKGWISGHAGGGKFLPNAPVTRAEAVTMINSVLGRSLHYDDTPDQSPFSDVPTDHWAYADIVEAALPHDADWRSDGFEIWRVKK